VSELARIHVEVFGCSANQADFEMVQGLLNEAGHSIVRNPKIAQASVILTCTVKTPTERKVVKQIRHIMEAGTPLIVAGCMPEAQRAFVSEIAPDASLVGPNNLLDVVEVVEATIGGERIEILHGEALDKSCLPRVRLNPIIHIAPIASGCIGSCSYCIVKRARGRLHSYPARTILINTERAITEGCKEIWVTAEDTAAYMDEGIKLPELLEKLTNIKERFYIRVGMMNPENVLPILDELINTLASEKLFKFLHIPVQSGNNYILERMRRKYSVDDFREIVERVRKSIPKLTLSTDIICGFPGETEEQFQDSIKLIEEIEPDVLNISRFWPRPGTDASKMKDQIHGRITKERSRKLSMLWRHLSKEANQRWIGWEGEILIDKSGKGQSMVGRNFAYKPVVLKEDINIGDITKVRVTEANPGYLIGSIV
jgi:MiaB-like tRNA modifying enzyme